MRRESCPGSPDLPPDSPDLAVALEFDDGCKPSPKGDSSITDCREGEDGLDACCILAERLVDVLVMLVLIGNIAH